MLSSWIICCYAQVLQQWGAWNRLICKQVKTSQAWNVKALLPKNKEKWMFFLGVPEPLEKQVEGFKSAAVSSPQTNHGLCWKIKLILNLYFPQLFHINFWTASLVAQMVKYLPAMWETRVRFLGQEGPLEKEMAIHFSTLAWKITWMEEPDRLQSMGSQKVEHNWATSLSLSLSELQLFFFGLRHLC